MSRSSASPIWWVIARRELLERLRSRWFIVTTLLGPLLLIGAMGVPVLIASSSGSGGARIAIVDEGSGVGASLAADLAGMGKGLAWLNGECIGRFWSARGDTPSRFYLSGGGAVQDSDRGLPTQRYYHLPADWLKDGENALVLFDETGGDPSTIQICEWTEEPK